jgi:hypothetical protein
MQGRFDMFISKIKNLFLMVITDPYGVQTGYLFTYGNAWLSFLLIKEKSGIRAIPGLKNLHAYFSKLKRFPNPVMRKKKSLLGQKVIIV